MILPIIVTIVFCVFNVPSNAYSSMAETQNICSAVKYLPQDEIQDILQDISKVTQIVGDLKLPGNQRPPSNICKLALKSFLLRLTSPQCRSVSFEEIDKEIKTLLYCALPADLEYPAEASENTFDNEHENSYDNFPHLGIPEISPPVLEMFCAENETKCPDFVDKSGYTRPGSCISTGLDSNGCPFVCPMDCGPNELLCPGQINEAGCKLYDICIKKQAITIGATICPTYCPIVCNHNQIKCPDSIDLMGCPIPGICMNSGIFSLGDCPVPGCPGQDEVLCPGDDFSSSVCIKANYSCPMICPRGMRRNQQSKNDGCEFTSCFLP